jgi:hypothetical protein
MGLPFSSREERQQPILASFVEIVVTLAAKQIVLQLAIRLDDERIR